MRFIYGAILSMVILLSILGTSISAQESSEERGLSSEGEEGFESEPREVRVDPLDGGFEIRTVGIDGDRIRLEFRADAGEMRLDFTLPENDSIEVQLRLTIESLLEYMDVNEDGSLNFGSLNFNDEVVQDFEIDEMIFEGPDVQSIEGGFMISVEYGLPEVGSLRLVFWIFGNETPLGETLVKPTEVKFDVEISSFPFELEETDLALMMELQTEVELEVNFTAPQVELRTIGERYEGFFGWSKMAKVDGDPAQVNSTVLKVETELEPEGDLEVERIIVLSYPRGEEILHDPVLGVSSVPLLPPPSERPELPEPVAVFNTFGYVIMVGVSSLFVVATLLARRRRK